MKYYDMYSYIVKDVEIYKENSYRGHRMIYPKKWDELSFEDLLELIDSIRKLGYFKIKTKYHSDNAKFTIQLYYDEDKDPTDIMSYEGDPIVEYVFIIDINNKGLDLIKDTISGYIEE